MSTALATTQGSGPGGVVAVRDAMDTLKAIRTFVHEEMKANLDFGVIPGTGKKNVLLLPGAQKVSMYYNTYPRYKVERSELGNGHVECLVYTRLVSRSTQHVVSEGVGSCSTMETKYRFRKAARVCPRCGAEKIIKGKAEYGGGWVCLRSGGGCGAKFADDDKSIAGQDSGQVENDNIHDQRNTVLKMAKKRSMVDAAISLGCMSELFTQDIDETYDLGAAANRGETPPEPAAHRHEEGRREVNEAFRPSREGQPSQARPDRTQSDHAGQPAPSRGEDRPPKTGRQLYAWARKQDDNDPSLGLIKLINAWARHNELGGKMTEWSDEEIPAAYAEAIRHIDSVLAAGEYAEAGAES